ncbi:MAG: hypothetical protein OEY49_15360, partial [Candidatus Heimdallarchaeota archaeon]|nr:hypothetical protein [Candidatus Heimdallarchaeota archaeon]
LIIPTIFSSFFKPPRKIRDVARLLLGINQTVMLYVLLLALKELNWVIILITISPYILFSTTLSKKRNKSNDDVCKNCSEVNNPRCSGLREYYDRLQIINGGIARIDAFTE